MFKSLVAYRDLGRSYAEFPEILPYTKSVGQKCSNGRLQYFWPKVLESAIPTLFNIFPTLFGNLLSESTM